jgi:D-aminoacyl-tRNA deacylase
MGDLAFETYRAAREIAASASTGARCHVHALSGSCGLAEVPIDPVLLSETLKADERTFLKDLDKLPVIHVTGPDNRLLPIFITSADNRTGIINDLNTLCVKIIRIKEITATERDRLIIKRIRFDPVKAREYGIPAGPLYRELAEGRPVEAGGRVVTPAMVSTGSEIRIRIPGLENIA